MSKVQITDEKSSSSAWQPDANKLGEQLQDAVDKGEIDKIKKILQHNEAFDKLDKDLLGLTLSFSIENSNIEILQLILTRRLIEKTPDQYLSDALKYAAKHRQNDVISLLHSKQKNVDLTITILNTAAKTGDLQTLSDFLIATRSDHRFNWRDASEEAIKWGQTPAFKVIIGAVLQNLNKWPNRDIKDKMGWQSAFSYAAHNNLEDVVKLLLDKARDRVSAWITGGVQVAIGHNHTKLVEFLLSNQAQNETRNYGRALEIAVTVSNPSAVKLILSSEEKHNNIIDLAGYRTALRAMQNHRNQAEVLRLLLADRNASQLEERDLAQIYDNSTRQQDYKRLALLVNHSDKLQNEMWLEFIHERLVVAILCAGYELPGELIAKYVGVESLASFNKTLHNLAREVMRSSQGGSIVTLVGKALPILKDEGSLTAITSKINYLLSVAKKLEDEGIPADISLDVLSPLIEYYNANNQTQTTTITSNASSSYRSHSSVSK